MRIPFHYYLSDFICIMSIVYIIFIYFICFHIMLIGTTFWSVGPGHPRGPPPGISAKNSAPSPVLRRSISALAWHNTNLGEPRDFEGDSKKSLRGLQGVSEIFIRPVFDDCVRLCWFVCVTDVLACPGRLACLTCPGLCMCETYVLVHVHLSICMFISCSYIRAHECQNHNG